MKDYINDDRPGEMTDEQLDQLLAAASTDLLNHIRATTNPNQTLTTIMARSDQHPRHADTTSLLASLQGEETSVSTMIRIRVLVRGIARDLALADALVLDARDVLDLISHQTWETRVLAHVLPRTRLDIRALDRIFVSARLLTEDLDLACAIAREPADTDARRRASELASVLNRAFATARALADDLDAQQVDASDADLSGMEIRNLDGLDGITWTRQTTWPPGIAGQVEEHSQEIRPGVYQVHLGDNRDRHTLALA